MLNSSSESCDSDSDHDFTTFETVENLKDQISRSPNFESLYRGTYKKNRLDSVLNKIKSAKAFEKEKEKKKDNATKKQRRKTRRIKAQKTL